jgi:putative membrane protein
MVKPEKFLSPEDRDRIRGAIEAAERLSAGEIRVLVVGRSARRSWLAGVLVGLVAGGAAWVVQHSGSWGHPGSVEILIAVAVGLAAAFLGAWFIPPSRASKDAAAWARARREFVRLGIGKTAGATGVLVMFSLYEHEAVVLADKAINDKVPPDTWSREVKILLDGVKSGRPADGIAAAVTEVGALLAKHFPRRDDDQNELSDDVVLR